MRTPISILVAAGASALVATGALGEPAPIQWRSDAPDAQVVVMDRDAVVAALHEAVVSPRRIVVTLAGPADEAMRARLAEAGIALVSPLGGDSYIARPVRDRLATGANTAAAVIFSIEGITPARRMHPALIAGDVPAYAVVNADPQVGQTVALSVMFHADATAGEITDAIAASGGVETSRAGAMPVSTLEVSEAGIAALASSDAVVWIEPVLPGLSECNAGCRSLVQGDTVFAAPYSLTGAGVGVMVFDAGRVLATHIDFQGRVTTHDATSVNDHSTHVAGTIGGAGVGVAANRGIAPGVTMRSFGFEYNGTGTFLATNPGDLESNYLQAFTTLGCQVANTSLGTNVEVNGFPCALQGDYTTTDALIDSIIRGSLGVPVRAVWAAGNERQGNRCDTEGFGDYYSIAPPACSKNAIVVGAVNSDTDGVTSFSSWGPTDDGRVKPDLVAPGCQASGDGGVTSTSSLSNTAYTVKCGTSMATPVATGVIALMVQDFKARNPGPPTAPVPSNAAYKALLIQSAKDIGAVGPDYTTGYGSIRAKDAIDLQRTARWSEGTVTPGGERVFLLDVPVASGKVRVTLVWDDAPGTPGITATLINDLDLVVTDPGGVRRYPWTLNHAVPSTGAVRSKEDHKNNVEQVVVDTPIAGVWTVVVRGTSVPSGSQPFAMAASHDVVEMGVDLAWIDAPPVMAMPGEDFTVRVAVDVIGQSLEVGSPRVRTRAVGESAWAEAVMTDEGGGIFAAPVTGPECDAEMELEVVATGLETGDHMLPEAVPAIIGAGEETVALATTSEADLGWTVNFGGADTATAGAWGRMDPEATTAQPGDDAPDVGAMCWVTDGRAGASAGANDIDGGMTSLTSPAVDLAGARSARVTVWGWFSNTTGADPGTDVMRIRASGDSGATWTTIDTIGPTGSDADGGWFVRDLELSGAINLTGAVRIRFEASDVGLGSVVEAAIDDVRITGWWCDEIVVPPDPTCVGDVNGDARVNVADFNLLATNFGKVSGATLGEGDVTGDGRVDVADFNLVAGNFGKVCP